MALPVSQSRASWPRVFGAWFGRSRCGWSPCSSAASRRALQPSGFLVSRHVGGPGPAVRRRFPTRPNPTCGCSGGSRERAVQPLRAAAGSFRAVRGRSLAYEHCCNGRLVAVNEQWRPPGKQPFPRPRRWRWSTPASAPRMAGQDSSEGRRRTRSPRLSAGGEHPRQRRWRRRRQEGRAASSVRSTPPASGALTPCWRRASAAAKALLSALESGARQAGPPALQPVQALKSKLTGASGVGKKIMLLLVANAAAPSLFNRYQRVAAICRPDPTFGGLTGAAYRSRDVSTHWLYRGRRLRG